LQADLGHKYRMIEEPSSSLYECASTRLIAKPQGLLNLRRQFRQTDAILELPVLLTSALGPAEDSVQRCPRRQRPPVDLPIPRRHQ
jgi:hypothetical protein